MVGGQILSETWLRCVITILICVVVAGAAWGEVVYPARTGRVVDEAGLLSQESRDSLTRQLGEHERKTSNQVVVVTVRSLQGLRIETYAFALANKWAVGQARRNNGVVLLVAPNERQLRIEVGVGLERRLTNAIAADIIEQRMLPAFRDGRPEAGIQQGVNGILAALDNGYQLVERPRWTPQVDVTDEQTIPIVVIAVLVGVVVIVIVLNLRSGGRLVQALSYDRERSDDDGDSDSRSGRRHRFGGGAFGFGDNSSSSSRSFSSRSFGGGGSFRGGGASGYW